LREIDLPFRIVGDLKNTEKVMRDTFWIGVYPGLTEEMIDFMLQKIRDFVKAKS
jgi:CDP-6-deoxy-D-xylo-4-hexulose-3-dehydrase